MAGCMVKMIVRVRGRVRVRVRVTHSSNRMASSK
jgi:hypothetical protein